MAKSREDLLLERLKKKYEGDNQSKKDDSELSDWEKFGAGVTRARQNVERGILGAFEGIADTVTGIAAKTNVVDPIGKLFGVDFGWGEKLEDFTKVNLTDKLINSDAYKALDVVTGKYGVGFGDDARVAAQESNALPEILEGVTQGIGSGLGFMATGSLGGSSKAAQNILMGASAGGSGIQQSLQEGATLDEALAYGALSGATEVALERITGGILNKLGLGTGKIAGIIGDGSTQVSKGASSGVTKAVKNIAKNFTEEGLEEVLSDVVNPLWESLTTKKGKKYNELFAEQGGAEGLLESFLYGGLTGGIFEGVNIASEVSQSGGFKGYDILDEAKQINELNNQLSEAILNGDAEAILDIQEQKSKKIKAIQDKFDKFVDQAAREQNIKKLGTALKYEQQAQKSTADIIEETVSDVLGGNVKVKYDKDAQVSSYDAKTKTMTISSNMAYNVRDLLTTVGHESTHVVGSTELVDTILENVDNIDALMNEYKEVYKDENLSDAEIREEIAADHFSSLYLNNLRELKEIIEGSNKNGVKSLKRMVQNLFSGKKRPKNYKKAIDLFNQGINEVESRQKDSNKIKYKKKISSEVTKNGQQEEQTDRRKKETTDRGIVSERQSDNENKRETSENENNLPSRWQINERERRIARNIFKDKQGQNNTHYEFFSQINRITFDEIIRRNKGYRVNFFKNSKGEVQKVKTVHKLYYTPPMREMAEENKKMGFETHFYLLESGTFDNSAGFSVTDPDTVYVALTGPHLIPTNHHERMHLFEDSEKYKKYRNELEFYFRNNLKEFDFLVSEIEDRYGFLEDYSEGKITKEECRESIYSELQSFIYEGYFILKDKAFQERINKEFDDSLKKEFGLKEIRYKKSTDNLDEKIEFKIDEEYDATKNFKLVTDNDEFSIKGMAWYRKAVDKFNEIEEKYNNDEITERKYDNAIEKLTDALDEEISNLEAVLYSFDEYDLEDLGQYENIPDQKQIIRILNYAHQIEDIINNELPITSADFSEHFDEESSIMQLFNVLQEPKIALSDINLLNFSNGELAERILSEIENADMVEYYASEIYENHYFGDSFIEEDRYKKYPKIEEYVNSEEAKSDIYEYFMRDKEARDNFIENPPKNIQNSLYSALKNLQENNSKQVEEKTEELKQKQAVEQPVEEPIENEPKNEPKVEPLDVPIKFDLNEIKTVDDAVEKTKEFINTLNTLINAQKGGVFENTLVLTDNKKTYTYEEIKSNYDKLVEKVDKLEEAYNGIKQIKSKFKQPEYKEQMKTYKVDKGFKNYWANKYLDGTEGNEDGAIHDINYAKEVIKKVEIKLAKETSSEEIKELRTKLTNELRRLKNVFKNYNSEEIEDKINQINESIEYPSLSPSDEEVINNELKELNALYLKEKNKAQTLNFKNELNSNINLMTISGKNYENDDILDKVKKLRDKIDSYDIITLNDKVSLDSEINQIKTLYSKRKKEIEDAELKVKQEAEKEKVEAEKQINSEINAIYNDVNRATSEKRKDSSSINSKIESRDLLNKALNDIKDKVDSFGYQTQVAGDAIGDIDKLLNSLQSRLLKQLENEYNKKVNVKNKTEVKEVVKEVVVEKRKVIKESKKVYVDSSKNVKAVANAKNMKYYNHQSAVGLTRLVKSHLEAEKVFKGTKVRLQFDDYGHEVANNNMFVAMNKYADNPSKLVGELYNIFKRGIQIKERDMVLTDDGKLEDRYRDVWTPMDSLQFTSEEMINQIETYVKKMISLVVEGEAKPTIIANKLAEQAGKFNDKIAALEEKNQAAKEKYKELVKKYNQLVRKYNDQVKSKKMFSNTLITMYEKDIKILSKAIDKYETELGIKTSLNKTLKEKVNELSSEIQSLKVKLSKTTNVMVKTRSQASGKVVVTRGVRNYVNNIISTITKNTNYKISDELFDQLSVPYSNLDVKLTTEIIYNTILDEYIPMTLDIDGQTVVEKAMLKDVYSQNQLEGLKQAILDAITARMNNPRLTQYTKLVKALNALEVSKEKLAKVKATYIQANQLQNKAKKINKLLEKKTTGVAPALITQVKGIAEQFKSISRVQSTNGKFRARIKEFWVDFNKKDINGVTLREQLALTPMDDELVNLIEDIVSIPESEAVSIDELKMYNKFMSGLINYITHAAGQRTVTIGNQSYTVKDLAYQGMQESKEIKIKEKWSPLNAAVDPRLIFEQAGGYKKDSVWNKIYQMFNEGETKFEAKWIELFTPIQDFYKNNKKFEKSLRQKMVIDDIEATKGQFLSLYKLLKREHAFKHIVRSGIEVDGKVITFEDEASVKKLQQKLIEELELNKDSVNKQYIDLSTKFFEVAKQTKVDVDNQIRGFTNVEDGEYFPIRVTDAHLNQSFDEKQLMSGQVMQGAKNYSFNKSTTGTLGAVALSNIDQVIALHGRQMAMYHGYALVLNDFTQIYNIKFSKDPDNKINSGDSMGYITKQRFGKNKNGKYHLDDYLNNLIRDMQGIPPIESETDSTFKKVFSNIRSKYASYQLGANLKVVLTQVSALPASMKYIKARNLSKALLPKVVDTKKYPMPTIGEYRNMNKSVVLASTLDEKIGKITDIFSKGMVWTDQKCIEVMWKASLLQTNYNVEEATKIFEKAIRETQPNYNALQRSGLLRTKNEMVKMLTMFTSQPSKNLTNVVELIERKRYQKTLSQSDKKLMVDSISSLVWQGAVYSTLALLFKWLLDKEEPEDFDPVQFTLDFVNDNIIGMIPFLNNVRLDTEKIVDFGELSFSSLSDMWNAATDIISLPSKISDGLSVNEVYQTINNLGKVTGVPVRNIYNYSIGLLKNPFPELAYQIDIETQGKKVTTKTELNKAIEQSNIGKSKAYYTKYNSNTLALSPEVNQELFRLYSSGHENAILKAIPSSITVNGEQVSVDKSKWKKQLQPLQQKLNRIIYSPTYKALKDADKEIVLSQLISSYHNLAKSSYSNNDLNLLDSYIVNSKSLDVKFLSYILNAKSKDNKSLTQAYINSLPLPRNKKYLIYYLCGYKLNDQQLKTIKGLL